MRMAELKPNEETYAYVAASGFGVMLREALDDLRAGARLHRTWTTLGWRDLRRQTRRTLLGPLWMLVGTGIQIAALGYVYGALLKTDPADGYPYIAAGLILWFFISGAILGGLGVFDSGRNILHERALPVSFTVFRYLFRLSAELVIKFILFVVIAVLVSLPVTAATLYALPAFALLLLNGFWVVLLLGTIGARYRDMRELVAPLMLLAFLATPILWQERHLGGAEFIAAYNPFTHYLAIVRDPLLGHAPDPASVGLVLVMTLAGYLAAFTVFAACKNRIVFWV